jgi:hypothetical protein
VKKMVDNDGTLGQKIGQRMKPAIFDHMKGEAVFSKIDL